MKFRRSPKEKDKNGHYVQAITSRRRKLIESAAGQDEEKAVCRRRALPFEKESA